MSKWEKAVDEDVLEADLATGYRETETEAEPEHSGDILVGIPDQLAPADTRRAGVPVGS